MTFVLASCKLYVTFRFIALKMGVLGVKNIKKHTFLAFSQFGTFLRLGSLKMLLLRHFLIFLAETFTNSSEILFSAYVTKGIRTKKFRLGATRVTFI